MAMETKKDKCNKPSQEFLYLTCTLAFLEELLKILMLGTESGNYDLIWVQSRHQDF